MYSACHMITACSTPHSEQHKRRTARQPRGRTKKRLSHGVPGTRSAHTWVVDFAVVLVNRYEVGKGRRTRYEWSCGKASKLVGLELLELVNFRCMCSRQGIWAISTRCGRMVSSFRIGRPAGNKSSGLGMAFF